MSSAETTPSTSPVEWWRDAVIYQIYPRSFADSDGDGVGDLAGIVSRLGALADLGVDAIWLSPFQRSPQKDAGYDVSDYRDVDPLFGTLADFDALVRTAHTLGLRVIVDLVPNHSSDQHPWFQAALAAGPGSPERARYLFRDGRGVDGELPPNNWQSMFGGPAWTRVVEPNGVAGQWYLHLFDSSQPDFDWSNEEVHHEFRDVLRFWLERGVDGFRVDVAHGLVKAPDLPDYTPTATVVQAGAPYWGQAGVHAIFRDWRALLDTYPGDRALCGEVWLPTTAETAQWVRPGEMHQTFNFEYLYTRWDAAALRAVIDESLREYGAVGAPTTWVLSNHDVVRHATRLTLSGDAPPDHGIGPRSDLPDPARALRRGRAATALMLALPGSAYLYQGEELGLPEVVDLPGEVRQDPVWLRTGGKVYGRDGCRVPIPWEARAPAYGFSPTGASWLPQPPGWAALARDAQADDPDSTLELYRALLMLRRRHRLGQGELTWLDSFGDAVAFRNGAVTIVANTGTASIELPAEATILAASTPLDATIPPDTTVWLTS
ncbi:MAG TPA: glycoside hydrolase family 13 protein [Ilumatobacter sp.]|nr:glycoside hydrolase family 13 protein [Ilumatobacter sp.]